MQGETRIGVEQAGKHRIAQERQQTEEAITREILAECLAAPVEDRFALVFSRENWHRGVLGIVASRLVERFHRPAFVLGLDPSTGLAQGSGRSVPGWTPRPSIRHPGTGHGAGRRTGSTPVASNAGP